MSLHKSKSMSTALSSAGKLGPTHLRDSPQRWYFGMNKSDSGRKKVYQSTKDLRESSKSPQTVHEHKVENTAVEEPPLPSQIKNPTWNRTESLANILLQNLQPSWTKIYSAISHLGLKLEPLLEWPLFLHLLVVLVLVWSAGYVGFNMLFTVLCGSLYLKEVDRMQKKWQKIRVKRLVEEEIARGKPFTDTESLDWFNALLEKCWGSWLEQMLSQSMAEGLHASMDMFKPQALSKLTISRLNLGNSPPVIKSAKVYRVPEKGESDKKDTLPPLDLILELDLSYVADESMSIEVIAKMAGISGRLVGNSLSVEGKLRLGMKFIPYFPYLATLALSFVAPPAWHLSLRPMSTRGLDVLDLPGVARWVKNSLAAFLLNSMVEPAHIPLDLVALLGTDYGGLGNGQSELRFVGDGHIKVVKQAGVAFVIVEVLAARGLEPRDPNGHVDAYVKLSLGRAKMCTAVKKRCDSPRWNQVFRFTLASWTDRNELRARVKDKLLLDRDDTMGYCVVDLSCFIDGSRHQFWTKLRGSRTGELQLAITIVGTPKKKSCLDSPIDSPKDTGNDRTSSESASMSLPSEQEKKTSWRVEDVDAALAIDFSKMSPRERRDLLFLKNFGSPDVLKSLSSSSLSPTASLESSSSFIREGRSPTDVPQRGRRKSLLPFSLSGKKSQMNEKRNTGDHGKKACPPAVTNLAIPGSTTAITADSVIESKLDVPAHGVPAGDRRKLRKSDEFSASFRVRIGVPGAANTTISRRQESSEANVGLGAELAEPKAGEKPNELRGRGKLKSTEKGLRQRSLSPVRSSSTTLKNIMFGNPYLMQRAHIEALYLETATSGIKKRGNSRVHNVT